jgi:hypothetical protein
MKDLLTLLSAKLTIYSSSSRPAIYSTNNSALEIVRISQIHSSKPEMSHLNLKSSNFVVLHITDPFGCDPWNFVASNYVWWWWWFTGSSASYRMTFEHLRTWAEVKMAKCRQLWDEVSRYQCWAGSPVWSIKPVVQVLIPWTWTRIPIGGIATRSGPWN